MFVLGNQLVSAQACGRQETQPMAADPRYERFITWGRVAAVA